MSSSVKYLQVAADDLVYKPTEKRTESKRCLQALFWGAFSVAWFGDCDKGACTMLKIGLDPGHSGRDPGAVYKGRKESDDVL